MFYRAESRTSSTYCFRKADGTKFQATFNSTTDAIDYAKRNGYDFVGTHSNVSINNCHPNYYLN